MSTMFHLDGAGAPHRIVAGEEGFAEALAGNQFNRIDAALPGAGGTAPDAIVYPQSEDDVVAAVRAARDAGQRIAVRSGGHSWVASSVHDDGVLIDLGGLDRFEIDAGALTATVQPAVRGRFLSKALEAEGVAFPVGHCGNPGVGGYLLGGGLGVNWGQWRPACFSVTGVRAVTADGQVRHASATENPDLFWLARGSGPGFPGIVTEFELTLQALPAAITVETWLFPLDDLAAVAQWITDASPDLPANVEVSMVTAGPERAGGLGADDPNAHVVGVAATVFAQTPDEAVQALSHLAGGPAAESGVTVIAHTAPFESAFSDLHIPVDATYPEGARYLADTFYFDVDLAEATAVLAPLMRSAPSGRSYVLTGMPANGAGADLVTPGEAAYGLHDRTIFIVYVIWDDPADDADNRAWLDEVAAALLPASTGHFLSEADLRAHPERYLGSFAPADRDRVTELRRSFDPDHVFQGLPGE